MSPTTQAGTPGASATSLPTVAVKDAGGLAVPGASVTFAVTGGGGTATGTTATTNSNGVANVGGWTFGSAPGSNTMTASVAGFSVTFTATTSIPGAKMAVTAGSTTAASRAAFTVQPVIQLQDASGGSVAQPGVVVTAAITSGGGTLGGTATATTNSSGAATFTGLSIAGTVGARVLTFTATGFTSITHNVALTAGAASTIAVNGGSGQTAAPSTAVATAPSVIVKDADGNNVSGTAVTFAVASGGGSVTGASATSNASGVATVGSWTLGPANGANTLTATSTGLTGSPVTFTATAAAPATKLAVTTAPTASVGARVVWAAQPVVQLQDAGGSSVSSAGVVVTVAITGGGGTLNGTATATTGSNGAATFTGLSIAGTVGARTLTFTATGLTSATATITVTAGAAATIAISAGNSQTAAVSTAVATAPAVLVTDLDANPVSGTAVTFAIATGGGTVTGASATSSASGIATVGSWTLGPAAGVNTLTATSTGLTGSPLTFTATGTSAGAFITYGATTEKIKLLDPAGTLTPTISIINNGVTQAASAGTYTSRATTIATVDANGKITAVGQGQTWVAATYQTKADSIFVIVTQSVGSPVLRADVTDYGVTSGAQMTVNITLDPRTATIGSAVVSIGYETQNNMFSNVTLAAPTQTPQPIIASVSTGFFRSTVAAAAGLTGPVVMGQLKLTPGSSGLVGWLTFTFLDVSDTAGLSLLSTTTSTRYPIIIR